PFAIRALEGMREPEHFELLIGVYKGLGHEAREAEVTRGLASLYRDRGDEESSREVLQRLSPEVMMEASSFRLDRSEVAPSEVEENDLLPDETFQVVEATETSGCAALDSGDSEPLGGLTPEKETVDSIEDWMAEASVYLRYGKPSEAIEVLQKVLEASPENREALERLGEAYVGNEQRAEAIDCWREALALSRCRQDQAAFDSLYRRMVEVDPDLADTIEPMASLESSSAALSLDPSSLSSVNASDEGAVLSSEPEQSFSNPEVELDLTTASGFSVGSALSESSGSSSAFLSSDGSDDSLRDELSKDSETQNRPSEEMASGIREDLEEAAFYLEQGLDTEAEQVYQRILEQAPQHPTALLKLGEVVSRRGGDPSAFVTSTPEAEVGFGAGVGAGDDLCPDDQTEMQDVEDLFGDEGIEIDLEVEGPEAPAGVGLESLGEKITSPESSETSDDEDGGWKAPELAEDLAAVLAEAEAAIEATAATELEVEEHAHPVTPVEPVGGLGDELVSVPPETLSSPQSEESESTILELSELVDEHTLFEPEPVQCEIANPEPVDQGALDGAPSDVSVEADFDLAAELADVFEEANRTPVEPNEESQSGSTLIDGFESVFADFKKGVSIQVASTDFDTHFDLAIAYREMALWDDAMAQFKICLASTERRVESLHMMALCALELGQPQDGVTYLEQALSGGEQSADRWAALYFDLGRAQRGAGDYKAAWRSFETVSGLDPQFPGLSEQRQGLASDHPESSKEFGGGLESFDDLVAEVTGSLESAPSPRCDKG
ncbi:tetratricopeptide repeat protein, partial [Myxococcota bacterium]|nr:tetratricopeptide repeat protein [Myxococcota bacterium]